MTQIHTKTLTYNDKFKYTKWHTHQRNERAHTMTDIMKHTINTQARTHIKNYEHTLSHTNTDSHIMTHTYIYKLDHIRWHGRVNIKSHRYTHNRAITDTQHT